MKFLKVSWLKKKIRGLALRIFNKIENNGNAVFTKNGEKHFINTILSEFKKRQNDVTIFDIGANVGNYSELLLEKSAKLNLNIKLHLFEPTEGCFGVLEKKFSKYSNVICNKTGLSDKKQNAIIYYDRDKSGLASLYKRNLKAYDLQLCKQENIRLDTAADYIEEKGLEHIDFVKIDVEGHEVAAFKGFADFLDSDFIDYLQFEYGGANLDSKTSLMEIYDLLEGKGFKIAKIMPSGLEIRSYKPFMENYQYANYVAISPRIINK
jgi:FkbM family methyltransferase